MYALIMHSRPFSSLCQVLETTFRDLPNLAYSPRQISRSTLVENEGYPF